MTKRTTPKPPADSDRVTSEIVSYPRTILSEAEKRALKANPRLPWPMYSYTVTGRRWT